MSENNSIKPYIPKIIQILNKKLEVTNLSLCICGSGKYFENCCMKTPKYFERPIEKLLKYKGSQKGNITNIPLGTR